MNLPVHLRLRAHEREWLEMRCTLCGATQRIFAPNGLMLHELLTMGRYWVRAHRHPEDTA